MNRKIPNGSYCLFKEHTAGSRNGEIVLVKHTSLQDSDFGSGYTVKEYHSVKEITEENWKHQTITLKPLSYNSEYENINIVVDELNDFKVIGVFVSVLC